MSDTRFIDVHTHCPAELAGDVVADFEQAVACEDLECMCVCALDLKLDYCADFPYMSTFATSNDTVAELRDLLGEKIVPFCHVDPREPDAADAARYWVRDKGFRGLKFYPPSGWYPDEERFEPFFKSVEELGVPALFHCGRVASHPGLRTKYANPLYLEGVAVNCPRLPIIVGHFGNPWQRVALAVFGSLPNVYFDLTTSGLRHTEYINQALANPSIGPGRLLLGTDGWGLRAAQRAREAIVVLRHVGLSEDALGLVCRENARRLLGP